MKNYLLAAVSAMLLLSCHEAQFRVEGEIENAQDSVLYFENVGLAGVQLVDSARLDSDGKFSFAGKQTEAPEFYRLRIQGQVINLSADSTETITIHGKYPNMAADYTVEGSDNCEKIREMTLKQIALQNQTIAVYQTNTLDRTEKRDSIAGMVSRFKDDIINNYIFVGSNKTYAYFALFMELLGDPIFRPLDSRQDMVAFSAVATWWDATYPTSLRAQNLHNIVIEDRKTANIMRAKSEQGVEPSKIVETGLIDIQLPDADGRRQTLTALKGKVVLLEFHTFVHKQSPQYILMLRELYNKYHAQGFEIYQVSVDDDEHFWLQMTKELPWICVRDAEGLGSTTLQLYNVFQLPEYFLIDRNNALVKRSQQMEDVEAEIKALL